MKISIIIIFLAAFSYPASAQDSSSVLDDFEKANSIEKAKELKNEVAGDLNVVEKRNELELKKAEYLISSLDHRAKVFQWQYVASIIIFILVMIIVASGLVLSYMHFYKDLKSATPLPGTEMELSLQGLKINSSIMGLVILVISIAFLYMYLIYVFPINELTVDNAVSK